MGFNPTSIDINKPEFGDYYGSDNNASFEATNIDSFKLDSVNSNEKNNKAPVEEISFEETKTEKVEHNSLNIDTSKIIEDAEKKVDKKLEETDKPKVNEAKSEEHKFVNYYQYNYSEHYSEGTIATSGCGPTSAAMALTYITGKEITPVETAAFGDGTYTCSEGTYWSYFEAVSEKYGVTCVEKGCSSDNIRDGLKDGNPVIISMGPGHFTSAGHFIVLRGIDDNGNIIVADPNSEERSNQTWSMDTIVSEGKEIWTFPSE